MGKVVRMIYGWEDNWYELNIEDLDEMNRWINAKKKGLETKPPKSMVKLDLPPSAEMGF